MAVIRDGATLEQRVIDIVADALSQPHAMVQPHSSLMDDLGAESIDFMDIVFRLEDAFGVVIPHEELWAGSIDVTGEDESAIAAGVARLRETMPDFNWERFPDGVTKNDLPRLITVGTITDYLRKHLASSGAA